MTRRVCTEYKDSHSNEDVLANPLILLDEGEGAVQPIEVRKVISNNGEVYNEYDQTIKLCDRQKRISADLNRT